MAEKVNKKTEMSLLEFKQSEMGPIMDIFDFASNMPASIYIESTGVKLPEACYRSAMISETRFASEEYLLNFKRSSIDMGLPLGVFSYASSGVLGSLSQRHLKEEEEHEQVDNTIQLPKYTNMNTPLGTVIRSRRSIREMSGKTMSLQNLSNILYYGNGVTGEFELGAEDNEMLTTKSLGSEHTNIIRTAPSGGGLFPIYLYIIIRNTEKIEDGIYKYMPITHALKKVRIFDDEDVENLALITEWGFNLDSSKVNLMFFYVYNLYENSRKYCDMGLTFALVEVGEIAQNIHLTCTALNLSSTDIGGYDKVPCEKFVGIDGLSKHIIHLTVIGA